MRWRRSEFPVHMGCAVSASVSASASAFVSVSVCTHAWGELCVACVHCGVLQYEVPLLCCMLCVDNASRHAPHSCNIRMTDRCNKVWVGRLRTRHMVITCLCSHNSKGYERSSTWTTMLWTLWLLALLACNFIIPAAGVSINDHWWLFVFAVATIMVLSSILPDDGASVLPYCSMVMPYARIEDMHISC